MKRNTNTLSIFDRNWEEKYNELKSYYELFGNTNVPKNSKKYKHLAIWVANQRSQFKKGCLNPDRVNKLNDLQFRWMVRQDVKKTTDCSWDKYMNTLIRFKTVYRHDLIPVTYKEEGVPLGNWVANMRRIRNRGDLTNEKIQALDAVGFNWDSKESAWMIRYNELKNWYIKNGDSNVPIDEPGVKYSYCHNYLKPTLGEWVTKQRLLKRKKKLPQDKIDLLDKIEFDWTGLNHYKNQHRWSIYYKRLKEKSDVNFTISNPNDEDYDLYEWCVAQRLRYQKGQLQPSRLQLLEEIGFKFHVKEIGFNQSWINKYNQYRLFVEEEGFENRKKMRKENQSLINWVNFQRKKYRNHQLEQAKVNLLNEIGFQWEVKKNN